MSPQNRETIVAGVRSFINKPPAILNLLLSSLKSPAKNNQL